MAGQSPYEEITPAEYEAMTSRLRPLRAGAAHALAHERWLESVYCEGGLCEL